MNLYLSHAFRLVAPCMVAAITTFSSQTARADVLFNFGTNNYSGDPSRSTIVPHITALFQDVSTGHVRLTLSAPGLTNNENIDKVYFNLNPAENPSSLVFSNFTVAQGSFTFPTVSEGTNAFKAGGNGLYDIQFNFGGSGLTTWFSSGDVMICDITGIPNLQASDFAYLNAPSGKGEAGPFDASVHIVSIFQPNGHGDTSGFVAASGPDVEMSVPEPKSPGLWILAVGLGIGFDWSRRQRVKTASA